MRIAPARRADCPALAETSVRAFDADVHHGAPGPGGPPGYDSVSWHERALTWARVFTLSEDDRPVGGVVVVSHSPTDATLGRVWLVPEAQGRGLGTQVLAEVEAMFPAVTRWTLDTPAWNARNHRFYVSRGYRLVGRDGDGLLFEKRVAV